MSEELFEIAFSGQIKEDADLEQVKAKVGVMFKADAGKLAQLFSGKRMVIKKNIDQATANKYKTALGNAGAVCEVKSLSVPVPQTAQPVPAESVPGPSPTVPAVSASSGHAPAAPKTDPLGISADDIPDLSAAVAPLGSDMLEVIKEVAEPELDISGIDMAPVGSDLGQVKKDKKPPLLNTDGLSLVD